MLVPLLVTALVTLLVVVMLRGGSKPLVTHVRADGFSVSGGMYAADLTFRDVTVLKLEEQLPRILARTNGFSAFGKLRGNFDVAGLGHGKVFAGRSTPPYVFLKTTSEFVFVGLDDAAATEALYKDLFARWSRSRSGG